MEMESLQKNNTCRLISLPEGKKTMGCKWVFSINYKVDGSIDRYKEMLVAKGFTQTYGIDYTNTFLRVAKLNIVRVLLSLATNLDLTLLQLDVKNVFLHGNLEEEVYMDIPPGYKFSSCTKLVCKLEKTLYGLKHSPRTLFGRFNSNMTKDFDKSNADHTLFIKHRHGKVITLIVYVVDMIIMGDDTEEISLMREKLATELR